MLAVCLAVAAGLAGSLFGAGPASASRLADGRVGQGLPGAPESFSPYGPLRYFVYWDQNEEEDLATFPSGRVGQLVPPYDPNGQMCIFPDGSGRFVTGYNPTLPGQHNPGSLKPVMQPPVGEAVWSRHGHFTGQTIYVPGPYKLPGQTVGGDIPPDPSGTFNNNGTFTGCAFDPHGNLFASDLGTAQGQFPPPTSGRVIEWFAPSYTAYCIVDGPTTGGVGPHHVTGTGGLSQPGDLAFDPHGDLLVPEADPQGGFNGRVLELAASSLPRGASDCGPEGIYPPSKLDVSVFVQGSLSLMPFPQSVAYDPACRCWGVGTTFGDPAIAWFDDSGHQVTSMGEVPGETITQVGSEPNGYNPFGIAFAPDGTLYFVDIHITCSAPLVNCGPAANGGRIMKVTFSDGKPNPPVPIAGGYNFPTSVTVCVRAPGFFHHSACPRPRGSIG
jgi:hypothetical protein